MLIVSFWPYAQQIQTNIYIRIIQSQLIAYPHHITLYQGIERDNQILKSLQ
jgi:hypothetical protein